MFIVKFGDTNGRVFDNEFSQSNEDNKTINKQLLPLQQLTGSVYNIGSGVVLERGIVIFDRNSNQDTSAVPFDQIIDIIKNVYFDIAPGHPITCYLPKFSSNVYNESIKVQSRLIQEFKDINIVPV